jgi:hypothetical protein
MHYKKTGDSVTGENPVCEDDGGYTFISEWKTGFAGERSGRRPPII